MAKIVEPDNTNKGELQDFIDNVEKFTKTGYPEQVKDAAKTFLSLARAVQTELKALQDRVHDLEINNGRGR